MTEGAADRPVNAFVVEDEPMGDGRTIHYYVWPELIEDDATDDTEAGGGSPPAEAEPDV